jgi:hypothetical protein
MVRVVCALAVVVVSVVAFAQSGRSGSQSYTPAVAAPSVNNYGAGYGGWGGGGGTVAGNAMQGMSSVISAKGSYNLNTSAAAVNMTQAEKQDIQNRQAATDAYFNMRATNRAATAAERGPHPSMEQLARIAADGAPKPLTSQQVDQVTGSIDWPDLLQDDQFKDDRTEVEKLLAKKASYGRLGYTEQKFARQTIDDMFGNLKAEIRDVPPQLYVASRSFLQSLMYSMTKTEID